LREIVGGKGESLAIFARTERVTKNLKSNKGKGRTDLNIGFLTGEMRARKIQGIR
jgi:hypothetical protein